MPVKVNGGVFNDQTVTGSMKHFVLEGADFSGAIDSFGQPVSGSAAEIIFTRISIDGFIDIMNPNQYNISFALETGRTDWDASELTIMVQSLGTNVGVDHIDCTVCTVTEVPYIWNLGGGATSFTALSDVPSSYSGAANYLVTVNPGETGLIFTPSVTPNTFSTIAVPTQTSVSASGSDVLTLASGSNVFITTNPLTKTVTISVPDALTDYIPVLAGSLLTIGSAYFITSSGTVTLPILTGSGCTIGQSISITKMVGETVIITVGAITDIISTDLGPTDSIEVDATEEIVLVCDGVSTWHLQIGAVI